MSHAFFSRRIPSLCSSCHANTKVRGLVSAVMNLSNLGCVNTSHWRWVGSFQRKSCTRGWRASLWSLRGGHWYRGGRAGNRVPLTGLTAAATGCLLRQDDDDSPDYLTVTVNELESSIDELRQHIHWYSSASGSKTAPPTSQPTELQHDWHQISKTSHYTIWSRSLQSGLSQYKVCAHYPDIPAAIFLFVQMDLEGRKTWDPSTDVVKAIDEPSLHKCKVTGSTNNSAAASITDLIYWRVNFPRPLAKRDYVFLRSCFVDSNRNVLVLVNKSTAHDSHPPTSDCVRVTDYDSQMVIQPHSTFTEKGFDYVLTYHDDTKVKMPSYAYKRIMQNNLPVFMAAVHRQALSLHKEYEHAKASAGGLESASRHLKSLHRFIQRLSPPDQPPQSAVPPQQLAGAPVSREKTPTPPGSQLDDASQQNVPWQRYVPIRKITPPQYLPDILGFAERLFGEGRLSHIRLKRYHSSPASDPASHPHFTSRRADRDSGGYPKYENTG